MYSFISVLNRVQEVDNTAITVVFHQIEFVPLTCQPLNHW